MDLTRIPLFAIRKFLLRRGSIFSKRCLSNLVNVVQDEGVRRIVLSDQKTRNSLSIPMVESILTAVTKDENDPDLRCIVLMAEGSVFSGGHNLKHLSTNDGKAVFEHFNILMRRMVESPVPVIACVDGLAAAAGCQLVAQCDLAICTKTSSFSTPGANFGVFCSTPGVALVRTVPRKLAAYMLFTGLSISAKTALRHGLVSHVVENSEELEIEIKKIAHAINVKSRVVVELGKRFFYKQLEMDLKTAYSEGKSVMLENLNLDDGKEGLKSFAEKRKPVWSPNKCPHN